jgi:hypothetical protein
VATGWLAAVDARGAGLRVRVSFGARTFGFDGAVSASTLGEPATAGVALSVITGGSDNGSLEGSAGTDGLETGVFDVAVVLRARRRGAIDGGVDACGAVEAERDFGELDLPLAMMIAIEFRSAKTTKLVV